MRFISKIDIKVAAVVVIALSASALIFQLFIMAGIIPYDVIWGGRLDSEARMVQFVSVSIAINLFIIFIVAMRGGFIPRYLPARLITIIIWLLVLIFTANTLGNLLAETIIEKVIFTPLTLITALMFYRLATSKETEG